MASLISPRQAEQALGRFSGTTHGAPRCRNPPEGAHWDWSKALLEAAQNCRRWRLGVSPLDHICTLALRCDGPQIFEGRQLNFA